MTGKHALAIAQELEEARSGQRVWISAKAAARLLGVHTDTLGEWRKRHPSKGPPWVKGVAGPGGRNQHVFYDYTLLVDWARGCFERTTKEDQLLVELHRVRGKAREIELELLLKREQAQLRKLSKRRTR